MSPTMTEGGVVLWKFKPGESFKGGDVLLEVETDKATIDVEASDDGILWQILEQAGATGIPVGKPIAYLAEPGDDLLTLVPPAVNDELVDTSKVGSIEETDTKSISYKNSETNPVPTHGSTDIFLPANPKLKLFPSVELLLQKHGISRSEAMEKIPSSGPNGRLLFGDILAHVGAIKTQDIIKIRSYVQSCQHLDLSSITLATKEELKKLQQIPIETNIEPSLEAINITLVPRNVRNLSLVLVLQQSAGIVEFGKSVRNAIAAATRDVYASKFPQYATSAVGSISNDQDALFDELMLPPVTQKRFEVVSVDVQLGSAISNRVAASVCIFDDLMSASLIGKPKPSEEEEPVTMIVDTSIVLDTKAPDAEEFFEAFKNALRARYPCEHLNIIG